MSICLCTLVLNERPWLEALYAQHRSFPELGRWVFVEACDRAYQAANPTMATEAVVFKNSQVSVSSAPRLGMAIAAPVVLTTVCPFALLQMSPTNCHPGGSGCCAIARGPPSEPATSLSNVLVALAWGKARMALNAWAISSLGTRIFST